MHTEIYMQIIAVGVLVLAAYYGSKITSRLRLGEIVGYILGGVLAGPTMLCFLGSRYGEALNTFHFFTFIFLGLIAFGIGDELRIGKIKKVGKNVLVITAVQAVMTWILITGTFIFLGFEPIYAIIIGSIGIATAPAATFVIMNKFAITGKLRGMLGGAVVLDDVIEIVFFSIAIQVALILQKGGEIRAGKLAFPVGKEMLFAVILGFFIFLVLRFAIPDKVKRQQLAINKDKDNIKFLSRIISEFPELSLEVFIIVVGVVSLFVGLAMHWHLPFLITAISAGVFVANFCNRNIFKFLSAHNEIAIYPLMFFVLIGANIRFETFRLEVLMLAGAYIIARAFGKLFGTWLGCKIVHEEAGITRVLPCLMLPQAGVAAIEAVFVATVLGAEGETILSIILPGIVFFEIVGIFISEKTLLKWSMSMKKGNNN